MRIFVTGHRGFVGKRLIKQLQDEGHDVYTNEADYRSEIEVNEIFAYDGPFDWVINCAAKVGGIQANINNPYMFLVDNLQIQNNIIDNAMKYNVKKVLFLGSSCIYPANYKQPLKEEYLLNAPVEKTNEGYALAKIAGLKMCEYANKIQDKTKFIVLMPSNLYGIGDHFNLETSHVLAALVKKICDAKKNGDPTVEVWGSGKPRREWLYVDDLVNCMIWSMNSLDKTNTFLNVGPGNDISIIELANSIKTIVNYDGKLVYNTDKPDGMLVKCMDVTKINKLGWKATTPFLKGLCRTIKYYQDQNEN